MRAEKCFENFFRKVSNGWKTKNMQFSYNGDPVDPPNPGWFLKKKYWLDRGQNQVFHSISSSTYHPRTEYPASTGVPTVPIS